MKNIKHVQVQWKAAHLDEARDISALLISKRLVACCSIIPLVESWFEWDGELQQESEVKVEMKTVDMHLPKIQKIIVKNHTYDLPEIIAFDIVDGFENYLGWIEGSVKATV